MKHIIIFIFLACFLLSCQDRLKCIKHEALASKTDDLKCLKFQDEAYEKGTKTGVCYRGPLLKGVDAEAIDPDPEACDALYAEAKKKCDALPPISERPEDLIQVSGSAIFKGKNPVMINGKPVCR